MKNATGVFASTFGAIWAPAGIEHGIGEMLQGSVAPRGVMFPSWPDLAFFRTYPDSILWLCIRYPDAIRLMITINSARM